MEVIVANPLVNPSMGINVEVWVITASIRMKEKEEELLLAVILPH